MQRITVITIGSLKESYWKSAVAEYSKRLSASCKLEIIELAESRLPDSPSSGDIEAALADESRRILAKLPTGSDIVAMCIEGKQLSSPDLAGFIASSAVSGKSGVCFVIGGSFGLSDEIKKRAALRLSFSEMTFPHQLFRVMLLEQIYRAYRINSGTRYHK